MRQRRPACFATKTYLRIFPLFLSFFMVQANAEYGNCVTFDHTNYRDAYKLLSNPGNKMFDNCWKVTLHTIISRESSYHPIIFRYPGSACETRSRTRAKFERWKRARSGSLRPLQNALRLQPAPCLRATVSTSLECFQSNRLCGGY